MQQLSYIAARAEDVRRTAEKAKEKLDRLPHIETLLITAVLPCSVPIEDARALRDSMRELFPAARILVHTSALKMAEMHLDNDGIMLVFLTFESSQAEFLMIRSETADEETKRHFVDFVAERPHTKLAGFFVVGMMDRIDDILASFSDIDERIEVFGAFVDAAPMQARGYILADDEEMTQGTLAVVFGGETLAACVTRNFGWNMLGREIVATHVDGCTIKELDGDMPLKIYERYFGIKGDDNFGADAALFPLCFEEEDGSISARVPIKIEEGSGELTFGVPIAKGTKLRLAYGDPYAILSTAAKNAHYMADFSPQVVMGAACVGHYLLLGDDVTSELGACAAFPAAASFMFGEVRRAGRKIVAAQLNVMLVGMKENAEGVCDVELHPKRVAQLSYNRKMIAFMSHFVRVTEEELNSANRRLSQLASRDALTNLLNRREMERLLQEAVRDAQENRTLLTVMLMDIDHFKGVNDTYGHDVGDKVLLTVADAISGTIRGSDAGCRWGGDEFFVILQGATLELAGRVGERIRRRVEAAKMAFDGNVTVSIGVAHFDPERDNELQLFKNADEALYRAKKEGRNAVYCLGLGKVRQGE